MNYQVNSPQVPGMPPALTRAAFNQNMAQTHAAADPRFAMKQFDKAGLSRGQGQQSLAGAYGAQTLAQGVAQAYAGKLQDAQTNASSALGNQVAAENIGQGMNAIAQQQSYANALAALQRQQTNQGLLAGLLNGLGF